MIYSMSNFCNIMGLMTPFLIKHTMKQITKSAKT